MNIEKLREEAARAFNESSPVDDFIPMEEAFIEGAKWEHERSKWVNVEDGLPPAGKDVLIKCDSGQILVDYIAYDGDWKEFSHLNIIRWTEIPKL